MVTAPLAAESVPPPPPLPQAPSVSSRTVAQKIRAKLNGVGVMNMVCFP
jgi:hypothetical protein